MSTESTTGRTESTVGGTLTASGLRQRIAAQDTSRPLTRGDILDRELLRARRLAAQESARSR